jgi:hypothetical protein
MDEIETGKIKCADLPQITVHRLEDGKTYASVFLRVSTHHLQSDGLNLSAPSSFSRLHFGVGRVAVLCFRLPFFSHCHQLVHHLSPFTLSHDVQSDCEAGSIADSCVVDKHSEVPRYRAWYPLFGDKRLSQHYSLPISSA